jgi:hypothetical protein
MVGEPGATAAGIPRQSRAREFVWRVHRSDGRVQSCEIQDDSAVGGRRNVMMLQGDEPLFSRRCLDEQQAC